MAKETAYLSDMDDSPVDAADVVTITIERQGETRELHVSEDQFSDVLEEAELLSAMYLSD